VQRTFSSETGAVISPFTVDQLLKEDLSVPEAMWIVYGIPMLPTQRQSVRLVSVDGFQVKFEEVPR
jgi:hypothetical protein